MEVGRTDLAYWISKVMRLVFFRIDKQNVVVSFDNGNLVLRSDPRCPPEPPSRSQFPDPGHDPCRGVRRGAQVPPAWTPEAVKTDS